MNVVQRRGVRAGGKDPRVGLEGRAVRDAVLREDGLELTLVLGSEVLCFGQVAACAVSDSGDGVCFADKRDLVRVFYDAAFVDGGFEGLDVHGGIGEEGYVLRDVFGDGESDVFRGFVGCEVGRCLGCGQAAVDVVLRECVFGE